MRVQYTEGATDDGIEQTLKTVGHLYTNERNLCRNFVFFLARTKFSFYILTLISLRVFRHCEHLKYVGTCHSVRLISCIALLDTRLQYHNADVQLVLTSNYVVPSYINYLQ